MKQLHEQIALALIMGILVPFILMLIVTSRHSTQPPAIEMSETETLQPTELQTTVPSVSDRATWEISILTDNGNVTVMDLDTYLTGVVLAEMPASFEPEALKSQAIVARTYTLRRQLALPKHDLAAVCTDSKCCQGYRTVEDYLLDGGSESDVKKVQSAVVDTQWLVLTYQEALIDATYFSCSGGTTEDAAAVWGTDIPYLQATDSPGEENARHYADSVFFTKANLESALGLSLSGSPEAWIGEVTRTDGGGVAYAEICGTVFTGTDLRKRLNLYSTAFSLIPTGDGITILSHGYGHRVGMSQYGADAMAVQGSSYREILQHYYQDTELTDFRTLCSDN